MLYVINKLNQEDSELFCVLDGVDGLEVDTLYAQFKSNFCYPKIPCEELSVEESNSLSNVQRFERYDKFRKEHQRLVQQKIQEYQTIYFGNDIKEMFVSYLKQEHGCKEIKASEHFVE